MRAFFLENLLAQNSHLQCYRLWCFSFAQPFQRAANGADPSWLTLAFFGRPNFQSSVESPPTCYRAPRWPDPEFPRKILKKYPPGRNSGTPIKYQKNTKKYQKSVFSGVFFGYFRGIFGVNSGSPEFQAGGYFFGIFRGNSGSGHLGALWQVGAFLSPEVPKCLLFKGFGTSGRKTGAPQKRQIRPRRI